RSLVALSDQRQRQRARERHAEDGKDLDHKMPSFPRKRESSGLRRTWLGPRDPAPAKAGGGDDAIARAPGHHHSPSLSFSRCLRSRLSNCSRIWKKNTPRISTPTSTSSAIPSSTTIGMP